MYIFSLLNRSESKQFENWEITTKNVKKKQQQTGK